MAVVLRHRRPGRPHEVGTFASVLTAIARDPDFAEAFRREVIGPKIAASPSRSGERAQDRGELRADVDLDLLEPALAGIVLHRVFLMGELPDRRPDHPRDRPDHPAGRDPRPGDDPLDTRHRRTF